MGTFIGSLLYIRVMFSEFWTKETKELNQEYKSFKISHNSWLPQGCIFLTNLYKFIFSLLWQFMSASFKQLPRILNVDICLLLWHCLKEASSCNRNNIIFEHMCSFVQMNHYPNRHRVMFNYGQMKIELISEW